MGEVVSNLLRAWFCAIFIFLFLMYVYDTVFSGVVCFLYCGFLFLYCIAWRGMGYARESLSSTYISMGLS